MNKHLLVAMVGVVCCGLFAGLFSPSIASTLTLPAMAQTQHASSVASPTTVSRKATPTASSEQRTPTPSISDGGGEPGPAQIDTLAQDSFHRGNQSGWGVSSDSTTWDGDVHANPDIFSVANNKGVIAHGNGTFNAILGPSGANTECLLDMKMSHFIPGVVNIGCVVRWTDNNDWYKLLIDGKQLALLKHTGTQTTTLQSVAFAAHDNTAYTLRLRVVGATLFGKVWLSGQKELDTWAITVTDASLSSGRAGIRVVVQPAEVVTINSFTVKTASSIQ